MPDALTNQNFATEVYSCTGRPETFGRPGQADNLAPLRTDILETFSD